MSPKETARSARQRRHQRVRKKVTGTAQRPRLSVFRSLHHIYAQVIDDTAGHTLVAASDVEADVSSNADGKTKTQIASLVGDLLAHRASTKGIKVVVFDRGGFKYHGRIKALAEAARAYGLEF